MATIKLYGHLKRFGSEFDLDINDAAEGIRALCYQIPGFKQAMQKGHYKVRIGKEYLSAETLEKGLFYRLKKGMKIHITPAIQGAKKRGLAQFVVGVVLIAASWYAGGAAGWAYLGTQAGATMAFSMGVSLALGGVAQMLAQTPSMSGSSLKQGEDSASKNTAFSNLENLSPQGRPVPLVYGEILTSGIIISQGIETFNKTESEGKETGTGNINTGGSSGGGSGGSGNGQGGLGDSLGWEDPDGLPNPNVVPAEVWKAAWREAQRRKEEKQKQNGG